MKAQMKKVLLGLALVMLVVPVAVIFSACGKGGDNGFTFNWDDAKITVDVNLRDAETPIVPIDAAKLIGKWETVWYYSIIGDDIISDAFFSDDDKIVWEFDAKGKYIQTFGTTKLVGHYIVDGDRLIVGYIDDHETQISDLYSVSFKDDMLILRSSFEESYGTMAFKKIA